MDQRLKDIIEQIDRDVRSFETDKSEPSHIVAEAMDYAMSAGGKRVRPVLMYLTYKTFGGAEDEKSLEILKRFMAAIEMIHTSSLVHDDLPALDNDSLRRGKPTVHVQYREDVAVLCGDALMNRAYEIAGRGFELKPGDISVEKALIVLMKKTGILGMLGGQSADVTLSGKAISDSEREYIYEKKTSALIEAPLMIGGILAGVSDEGVQLLEKTGRCLGLSFQVRDDILDITSDADTLGKETSQDEKNNKSTYPGRYGLEAAERYVEENTVTALEYIRELLGDKESLYRELLESFISGLAGRIK